MSRQSKRKYATSHPWLTFSLDLTRVDWKLWVMLGECQSKIDHLAGIPLRPEVAETFRKLYLAKGAIATTAIEGNTLTENDAIAILDKTLTLPPSREYLQQEVQNIIDACNVIFPQVLSATDVSASVERIKEYNRLVLRNLELDADVVPGEISRHQVTVGRYVGAPREDCDYLLDRLVGWLNTGFQPVGELKLGMAILKAVLAHLYIAWIHPFGDGNGRTSRLLEFHLLCAAGVPAPAAHLLSNHYNLTRDRYYRELDRESKSNDPSAGSLGFVMYAVEGLRDGLREQIDRLKQEQTRVTWVNYVHEQFQSRNTKADTRRRHLVLDLSAVEHPVPRAEIRTLTPRLALAYAAATDRMLSRDLDELLRMNLIRQVTTTVHKRPQVAFVPNREVIAAFLPPRRASSVPVS